MSVVFEDASGVCVNEGEFNDAHAHLEHAKSHADTQNSAYRLGRVMVAQARSGTNNTGLKKRGLRSEA